MSEASVADKNLMKKWLPVIGVVLSLYLGLQWQLGRLHLARDPASLNGNTCEGKRTCAVVYLAPWCPYCKADLPHTQMMLSRSKSGDTGVRVVVGAGHRPGDNEAMARRIASAGVEIDADLSVAEKLGVRSYPSYIVLDKEGTKLVDGQEGYEWVREKFGN